MQPTQASTKCYAEVAVMLADAGALLERKSNLRPSSLLARIGAERLTSDIMKVRS